MEIAFVVPYAPLIPVFAAAPGGAWHLAATLAIPLACTDQRAALLAGHVVSVPPAWPDLEIDGHRVALAPFTDSASCGRTAGQ